MKKFLVKRTSSEPIKGDIVSGSSGATAPKSFQFFVKPSLIEDKRPGEVVRLYRIAIEFASCGHSVVVSLSRYMPTLASQNTSLNLALRALALAAHASARVEAFRYVANSALLVRTCPGTKKR